MYLRLSKTTSGNHTNQNSATLGTMRHNLISFFNNYYVHGIRA